jgi:hypothetical protein
MRPARSMRGCNATAALVIRTRMRRHVSAQQRGSDTTAAPAMASIHSSVIKLGFLHGLVVLLCQLDRRPAPNPVHSTER